jgi:tetratricopeptide (TPR) repeat protein
MSKNNTSSVWVLALAILTAGCSEVRGRRKIQEANKLYKDGQYKEAVAAFVEAEQLVPNLPVLWINKGTCCRAMLIPGSTTAESKAAAKCAIDAFVRYQQLAPQDSRGEMLYVQTLFDNDQYDVLGKMYEERFKQNPKDIDSINGLIQVYSKANKLEEALDWYGKKADVLATDPEAQYSVGVFIWQQLMQKGGGPDKASFDPRLDPNKPREKKTPPPWGFGDLVSQQRIDLADMGIKYLMRAVELRPKYHESMTYAGLLNRQKSFAFFDQPEEWQKAVDEAEKWRCKSVESQGKPLPASCTGKPGSVGALPPPGEEVEEAPAEAAAPASGKAAPATNATKKKAGARKGKRGGRR